MSAPPQRRQWGEPEPAQGPQVNWHCPWMQSSAAHEPFEQIWHAATPAQSDAAAQAGGVGEVPASLDPGGVVPPPLLPLHHRPQAPLRQPLVAQVPFGHSWHSMVVGPQSASVVQVPGPGPGGGGLGALHDRTQAPLTQEVPAQVPSLQTWQTRVSMQSALVLHAGGGGGEAAQVIWHWPLRHAGAAQLPSEQGEQTAGTAQSALVPQAPGAGGGVGLEGPQVNWHAPWTQARAAQVPLEHCGHAPTAGQSASLWQPPGLGPDEPAQASAHWPFKHCVCAQLPSGQSWQTAVVTEQSLDA